MRHPTPILTALRTRLAHWLAGDLIAAEATRAALSLRPDHFAHSDDPTRETDLDYHTRMANLDDALEAWSINPFARRIVNLHTSHVIGRNFRIGSTHPHVDQWVQQWWHHPKNRIHLEIYDWADELCRAGELFFALFTNPMDGMQYIRAIPARRIAAIETNPHDYRHELRYGELPPDGNTLDLHWWLSPDHPDATPQTPIMLHYAINRPAGAVRSWGGDLEPMLPWLARYTDWLKDRVRVNASRNSWAWKMTAASDARVQELAAKYRGGLTAGSVWIGTPNEDLQAISPHIDAGEAAADGRALRQTIAVGGNVPPHMISDTEGATRSTARESNAPTFQWWTMRQRLFATWMQDLAEHAIRRAQALGKVRRLPRTLSQSWTADVADLTREDNQALAQAAATITEALATMRAQGWIDDATAIQWAAKFAGEDLDPAVIMSRAQPQPATQEEPTHEQA